MRGKKITLYLVEGDAKGIIDGKIEGISLKIIRAPRIKLRELEKDLRDSGIYFLTIAEKENMMRIYIGESEDVFSRLKTHEDDEGKDKFEDMYIIKTTDIDSPLTKGHIRYLENKLIKIAQSNVTTIYLDNKTAPEQTSPLSKADMDLMDDYLDSLLILLPAMGLNLSIPVKELEKIADIPSTTTNIEGTTFIFKSTGANVTAKAKQFGNEFVVLKDSQAVNSEKSSMRQDSKELKLALIERGILSLSMGGDKLIFNEDVSFTSPSAAASFILGQSINGRHYWLLENNLSKTYGTWLWEKDNS